MKYILFILVVTICACGNKTPVTAQYVHDTVKDTIKLPAPTSFTCTCDSVKKITDSFRTRLFIEKYKIARVKYYLNICKKNPKQDRFLKSWISRAIQ